MLENQVKEIRRKLSIAKAELDRIKKNDRITRKGRRNRKELLKECKEGNISRGISELHGKKERQG